ncbi:MAG: alkyl hydroperoxide reductase/Thiol specific antioxidant/Mal allergen, partial [Bacteriovoracaceae bacterium]|nr:alkyl hydroperoxide reductase/Thiol specific antioxidant/Mal allergen [Bacteriovoracaceae bacterium]
MTILRTRRIESLFLLSFCLIAACHRDVKPISKVAVSEQLKEPVLGKEVPDFELEDSKGQKHRLSDFRGNLVFLNFWATWCPPCIQEFPLMEALNQKFKAKSFSMIGVSVDQSWVDMGPFFSS